MANLEGGGNNNNNKLGDEEKLLDESISNTSNDHQKIISSRNAMKFFLLFSAVALSSLLLYHSSTYNPLQFFPNYSYKHVPPFAFDSNYVNTTPMSSNVSTAAGNSVHGYNSSTANNVSAQGTLPSNTEKKEKSKLEEVLEKAAMGDKTVIITTLNAAWTEPNSIFDTFLKSFSVGNQTKPLLKHVVVAALDQTAYSRCLKKQQIHCYALTTKGVDFSGEAHFMSEDYLKMMWRRIHFLTNVLQMGYNFIFTDADILWFRPPFTHFYPDADFQIACDHYWFNSTDLGNSPNGGFNYVKSNERTIQFYKFWYKAREAHPGKHDQDVLNMIKSNPFIKDIGLKIRFLDTALFGGFCEPSKDLNHVCTMHANCCIGIDNKMHDLTMALDDWEKYMALPGHQRMSRPQTWTVPRICG